MDAGLQSGGDDGEAGGDEPSRVEEAA